MAVSRGRERMVVETEWADPGFFSQQSPVRNLFRVVRQMVVRPAGHKTMPTKSGLVLILLTVGIGSAAYNTASNILFITLALLLSCLLLSGLLSWVNFKGLRWRLLAEPHVRAGEPTPVAIEVHNEKKWLPTYSLWFTLDARASEDSTALYLDRRLDGGSSLPLQWLLSPRRRGIETIAIRQLRSQFPFGFLRKTIDLDQTRELTVWPARIDYRFQPQGGEFARRDGTARLRTGGGTELMNVRPYRAGDPTRLIHWKASARQHKLLVREMEEEHRDTFLLYLETDSRQWTNPAQFETLCSLAASLAEDLFRAEQLRGAAVDHEPVHTIRRVSDLHAFLDRLARLEPNPSGSPSAPPMGGSVIRFGPGEGNHVSLYVGSNPAGTT